MKLINFKDSSIQILFDAAYSKKEGNEISKHNNILWNYMTKIVNELSKNNQLTKTKSRCTFLVKKKNKIIINNEAEKLKKLLTEQGNLKLKTAAIYNPNNGKEYLFRISESSKRNNRSSYTLLT